MKASITSARVAGGSLFPPLRFIQCLYRDYLQANLFRFSDSYLLQRSFTAYAINNKHERIIEGSLYVTRAGFPGLNPKERIWRQIRYEATTNC